MKYLKYTYVDAVTGIPVTEADARNGPVVPAVNGLVYGFDLQSAYPTPTPTFYGTAPDSADLTVPGVLAEVTEAEYDAALVAELAARKVLEDKRLVASIARRRYEVETAGLIWKGMFIATDRESQGKIERHRSAARDGLREDGAVWKCDDPQTGEPKFRPTSNAEMLELGALAFNYVQSTYAREGELMAGVAAGTTTLEMIEAWQPA